MIWKLVSSMVWMRTLPMVGFTTLRPSWFRSNLRAVMIHDSYWSSVVGCCAMLHLTKRTIPYTALPFYCNSTTLNIAHTTFTTRHTLYRPNYKVLCVTFNQDCSAATRTGLSANSVRWNTASYFCIKANQRIGPTRTLCRLLRLGLWVRVRWFIRRQSSVRCVRRGISSHPSELNSLSTGVTIRLAVIVMIMNDLHFGIYFCYEYSLCYCMLLCALL